MAQAMMNATTTSEDGFISYAREDRDLVDRLHAALLERGKKTWVDWEGIAPSAEWLRTIFEAIDRAQVFIVVISPDLLQSRTCMMEEVRHALEVGKKIIPIVGRDFVDDDVPEAHAGSMEGLRKLNYVFLRQGDDFPRGVDELVRALETDHEHVRWHTEYLRSARMWQQAGERRALLLRGDVLEDAETWLTTIGDKKPPASELQLEFIRASRTASRKRRRQLTGVLILGFVLMSALAGVALWQGSVAEKAQQVSERERDQARHQEGLAWLERANNALKDKVFFDARMYAGRALGFPGYEPEPGGDSFPPLLRAESEYATNAASLIRGSPGFDQLWQTPVARHHRSKIKAMARSKSGDIIASVAMDGFLRIWDRGAPREHINAHAGFLTAVAVSPDGRWVVAGGYESTVVVYDVQQGRISERLPTGMSGTIDTLDVDSAGRLMACISHSYFVGPWTVQAWSIGGDGDPIFTRDTKSCKGVGLRSDGALLVPDAAMLNAYDPKTGELLSKDAIKLDDKRLAGVSGDGTLVVLRDVHTISILSTKDGTRMAELPDGSSQEFSFSPNGETVAGIGEGILRVWRLRDAKLLCEVTVPGRSDLMWRDSKRILMSNGSQLQILQVTPCPESLQSDAGGGRVTSSVSNYFASFDARGQRLIYVDKAGRIEVRSARTLEIERVFDTFDYKQSPYNATVGIDTVFGRVGIGNEGGGEVTVWELGSGKQLTTIDSGLDKVASLTFSRTGEHLAVGSWDGGLNILSIADPTTSTIFRDDSGRGRGVGAVDFHPDGTRIAAGIGDDVVLFQLDPPKTLWKNSYGNSVKSVRFDHTGETLYVGTHRYGTSDTLKVLDATTGRERSKLFGHEESVEWITLRPDGKMLASGGGEGTIRLWEMPSGEPVAVLLGAHRGEIKSLSFSPDGTMLLSAGGDEVLRLWDVAESQSAAMYTLNNSIKLQATQDGILYAFSGDGRYQALDIGTQVVTVQGTIRPGDKEDNLPPLAVSGDGTKVAAAASSLRCVGGKDPNCQVDEKIYYHDLPANRSLGVLDGHEDGVDALAFSRDASMLASGGHKGDLKIWNLSTQEARILRFATGSRDRIEALAFGAGDTILAVARARAVSIIDIVSGTETGALKGHRNTVQKIAVSRDGRLLASGDGNEVLVWDMTSRRLIVRLSHPGPYVSELAFGPGDRLLAAAGSRSARVWSTRRWDDWVDVNPSASQALAFSADGKVLFTTRSGNFWETIRVVDAWLIDNALKPTDWRRDLAALDMSSSMEWRDVVSQLDEQITLPAPKWPPYTYLGLSDRVWDHGPNERIVRHLLQRGALEGARHALRSAPQLQANKDLVDALVVAHIEAIRQLPTKHALPVLRAAVSLAPSHARLRIVIAIMIVQMLSEAEKNGESDAADRLLLEEAAQHFQRAEELGLDPLRFLNRMKGTMVDEPLYTELMEALRTLKEAPSNSTPANGNRAKP